MRTGVRGKWVWDSELKKLVPYARRDRVETHHVITDSMPDTAHPCDGKRYDSKSAFRRVTKAFGCVEMGNDVQEKPRPEPDFGDIKRDIAEVMSGYGW